VTAPAPRRLLHAALDAWVLALACFALLGFARGLVLAREDWNWLWVGGHPVPGGLVKAAVLLFSIGVLSRRRAGRWAALPVALLCTLDALRLGHSAADTGTSLSESLVTAALLLAWTAAGPARVAPTLGARASRAGMAAAMGFLAMLGHVFWVGSTRHDPLQGDAVVVLGARVHADGRPSGALEDRTNTACDIHAHTAPRLGHRLLVLSGGRDPQAPISEPEAMARICRARGLPEDALLLDETGNDTRSTVATVRRLARERGWRSVLVVSHDYHLARIQWAFRDAGVRALATPCRETHDWPGKPWAVLREVAALALYLVRG